MVKKKEVKADPKYELWRKRIDMMGMYMSNAANTRGWADKKKFYKGDYKEALGLKDSTPVVTVNMVKAFVDTAVADLFARHPKFKCNPLSKLAILASKLAEQAINYFWLTKKVKRQIKKSLKEAKLIGYSWIKTGYNAVIGIAEDESEYVQSDDIFAIHVDNDAVWYDPDAVDPPHDCNWMIHRYLKRTDELSEKYGKEITPTSDVNYIGGTDNKKSELAPQDKNRSMVYEIWDIENKELLYICDGYKDGFIEEPKEWPYTEMSGFPFSLLTFDDMTNLDDKYNIPFGELDGFMPQILEKMKLRSMQINHIKRFSRQMLINKDKISTDERTKYEQGVDGAMIEVDGSPADAILPIQYAAMQPEMYAVEQRIDQDMDRISGQSGMRQGISVQTKTRTLGEVEAISESSEGRVLEDQDTVEEFTENVALKILSLMKQFYDGERVARITGDVSPLDQKLFAKAGVLDVASVKYNKESLAGEYDMEIVAGSTLPMNPQRRLNNLIAMARYGQAFGLTPDSMPSLYLGQEVMESMELKDVSKAYELHIQEKLQPKKPDPMNQLKVIQAKQNVDKSAADTQLKKTRIEGNNISNVAKALKNQSMMEEQNEV